jgi:hypothetical protein
LVIRLITWVAGPSPGGAVGSVMRLITWVAGPSPGGGGCAACANRAGGW